MLDLEVAGLEVRWMVWRIKNIQYKTFIHVWMLLFSAFRFGAGG